MITRLRYCRKNHIMHATHKRRVTPQWQRGFSLSRTGHTEDAEVFLLIMSVDWCLSMRYADLSHAEMQRAQRHAVDCSASMNVNHTSYFRLCLSRTGHAEDAEACCWLQCVDECQPHFILPTSCFLRCLSRAGYAEGAEVFLLIMSVDWCLRLWYADLAHTEARRNTHPPTSFHAGIRHRRGISVACHRTIVKVKPTPVG